MKKLLGSSAIAAFLFVFAPPGYADWGAMSAWTYPGQTNYCTHSSPSRKVRVQTFSYFDSWCEPNPITGQCVVFTIYWGDDAIVKNVSKTNVTADIYLWGLDANTPPSFQFPYIGLYQDVPLNGKRALSSTRNGALFSGLRASCQVSDNG